MRFPRQGSLLGVTVFFVLALGACARQSSPQEITPAFYYWRTAFSLTPAETAYCSSLGVKDLYVKFFDVDWDELSQKPMPVAVVRGMAADSIPFGIVPTVFITNRTLARANPRLIAELGRNIAGQVRAMLKGRPVMRLQLDCDWTAGTRDKYFALIGVVRKELGNVHAEISATIRLHQAKYRQATGVPPVDRGTLMFYNMGDLANPATENSILDLTAARRYVDSIDTYPIPLDVALPLYSWGVLYRRGRPIALLHGVTAGDFADSARFTSDRENVTVRKGTFFNYQYLYAGDHIRLEHPSLGDLEKSVDMLQPHIRTRHLNVIFYHLDPRIISRYSHEELQSLCRSFR